MRLFILEVKRIMKSQRTLILVAVILLMAVVMAIVPVSFEGINRPEKNGGYTELDGIAAINYTRDFHAEIAGDVTPDRLADALRTYQSYVQEYGSIEDVPREIYMENVMAIRRMLQRVPEAYANPKNGWSADLMDIDPDDVEQHFYERCVSHLNDVMNLEQKDHESARNYAAEKYANVDTPFWFQYGISRDAFDYIELYILLIGMLFTAIAAPAFSDEYQTGSDNILRCTKFGRMKLAITRILAVCSIFVVIFILGMSLHLTIINLAFGTDCLKSSIQMLFSVITLSNINLGQLQLIIALAGLMSVMAIASCTLFISAKCRNSLTVLLISMGVLLFPTFAYSTLDANWLLMLFPSVGIGLKNDFLYQLCDFKFLYIGDMSIWTPYVILIFALIEIPAFLLLAIRSYCKHQVQ